MKPAMRWGMPLAFGVFQGLMPLLGYFAGSIFEGFLPATPVSSPF